MPSRSTNNANLDKTNFDMFYKIDCCAAIHGQIWMNNVPNESKLNYAMMHWNKFCCIFFQFEKIGVKPGFPFTQLNSQKLTEMIAEQSSIIQYAWPKCHNNDTLSPFGILIFWKVLFPYFFSHAFSFFLKAVMSKWFEPDCHRTCVLAPSPSERTKAVCPLLAYS